ncbi:PHP domain-containing protein [Gilvimarinus sp. SDUM040013]|uniref:PHP domain-containing protein n=1 Tax=Gilvimarinus gilvus TaxID=3058038 RepID=A0ABU4RXP7_9GAMM|nr:PHP domain-containing protein [Gilvimarinus sp. SDUM040013]MDO3386419.1 PHP domain-containing protein [Gilvimarinus sp. SDUM040013]MDX6849685.1 PHP domain-containing protein [Gilvimarinus sp. SDUM040013]
MTVDLHMHSTCSDGALSPRALVQRACEQGVSMLALTDHDTLAGIAEAKAEADALSIQFINGIEFSSRWGKIGVHIVGLNMDISGVQLRERVAQQARARRERNEIIAQKLDKLGVKNAYERACALASDEPGRPHFAQLLVEDGLVIDTARAFKKYLGSGKMGDIRLQWPQIGEIVASIKAAGGVAVLAHPAKYGLTRTKLRALVADFAESGGEAMEIISGHQVAGVAQNLTNIAQEFGLLASQGSDFHRPGQPWQELGAIAPMPAGIVPVWRNWL